MNLYVLDASAWLRFFIGDGPVVPNMKPAAVHVERGSARFVAPELILIEAAHALLRKVRRGIIDSDEEQSLWKSMRLMPIELQPAEPYIDDAVKLASKNVLSVYDALYLAVALRIGAALFTADDQLAAIARNYRV